MAKILSFQVVGAEQVRAAMQVMMDESRNLTFFWQEVFAPKFFAEVQDLFSTGGRSREQGSGRFSGGAWAQLSPTYRVWKQLHYPGQPILVREGTLRSSLQWRSKSPGPGGILRAFPDSVIAGTSVPHGVFHQEGTRHMPARPFLPTPDPKKWAPLIAQWILTKARAKKTKGTPK